MSARQYPRQPAISSHIYSPAFSVLFTGYVCVSQLMYFYIKVCAAMGCHGEVTESYIGHTIYRMCLCVCVDALVCACVCGSACVCLFFLSDAPWWSLKLVGPPVASLLVFLHPSPLGRVLAAARPRPPYHLRAPLLAVLRLLIVLRCLATQRAQIQLTFLGSLAPHWPVHCWSSGLRPCPALRWTGLLLLGVWSQRFRP